VPCQGPALEWWVADDGYRWLTRNFERPAPETWTGAGLVRRVVANGSGRIFESWILSRFPACRETPIHDSMPGCGGRSRDVTGCVRVAGFSWWGRGFGRMFYPQRECVLITRPGRRVSPIA
jgi:hypothetical protein